MLNEFPSCEYWVKKVRILIKKKSDPNQSKSNQSKPNQSKPNQNNPNQSNPNQRNRNFLKSPWAPWSYFLANLWRWKLPRRTVLTVIHEWMSRKKRKCTIKLGKKPNFLCTSADWSHQHRFSCWWWEGWVHYKSQCTTVKLSLGTKTFKLVSQLDTQEFDCQMSVTAYGLERHGACSNSEMFPSRAGAWSDIRAGDQGLPVSTGHKGVLQQCQPLLWNCGMSAQGNVQDKFFPLTQSCFGVFVSLLDFCTIRISRFLEQSAARTNNWVSDGTVFPTEVRSGLSADSCLQSDLLCAWKPLVKSTFSVQTSLWSNDANWRHNIAIEQESSWLQTFLCRGVGLCNRD